VSMASNVIYNCKSAEETFILLEPSLKALPDDVRLKLEEEMISHGVNGESLIFLRDSDLSELSISDPSHQQTIMQAIYSLYDTQTLSNYVSTFHSLNGIQFGRALTDHEIDLRSLKNEGHSVSFYKNYLQIHDDDAIRLFVTTLEMIFLHQIDAVPSVSAQSPSRVSVPISGGARSRRESAMPQTTLPKMRCASSANLDQMHKSIEQYTSTLNALRGAKNAKDVLSAIEPLSQLNGSKLKEEIYAIPATQMLHKIMFHDTSIAQREHALQYDHDDEDSEMTAPDGGAAGDLSTRSVLNYIATNKITSTLGTSLLCNEGLTMKELQLKIKDLIEHKKLRSNAVTGVPDASALLTIGHHIQKSLRQSAVSTIAFLAIDVDSFYVINEQYGEEVGDALLKQIGEALFYKVTDIHNQHIADHDADDASYKCCEFYHAQGNRFYVLLSVSSEEEAYNFGSTIVQMIREQKFEVKGVSHPLNRTVSVSVYLYNPRLSVNTIKSNGHIPLLYAKHHGKNQVMTYEKLKKLRRHQFSKNAKSNIWSKQMYDLVGVYGKYSYHLCKVMTKRLINHKDADLNWKNGKDGNNTVLMYCIENGCSRMVQFYLKTYLKKLDLNAMRDDGSNALLLSIKHDLEPDLIERIMVETEVKNRNVTNQWGDNTEKLAQIKGLHRIVRSLKSS